MAEETENLSDQLSSVEAFFEQNKKAVGIGTAVVAVIVVAVVFVMVKWLPDQNLKAQKAIYMAEFEFAKDSFATALNGSPTVTGFTTVASKYSYTKTGNLANYYAGICCLNLKQFDNAIKYLDKFSTSDAIIGGLKLNAMGDAYMELGKTDDGLKYYQKAADFSDNESYTPYYLLKTGLAYEKNKKYAEAKQAFEKVRDKYPRSDEGRDIEKHIARVSAAI